MESKICTKCKKVKLFKDFYIRTKSKDGLTFCCKICTKNNPNTIQYNKDYYKDNKERILKISKIYRKNNPEQIIKGSKNWRENNGYKIKEYRENNKEKHKLYLNERWKNDPIFRLKKLCGNYIRKALNKKYLIKSLRTEIILGCSFEEFKLYLESKFESWMNWENYGKYNGELNHGWDIDHIIPLSNAQTEEEIYKLNHFSNLQPLCSKVNRDIKFNKINLDF